ncbi:MAG: hypothetical protein ACI9TF_000454, partial [Paracrocinitomix sp.]
TLGQDCTLSPCALCFVAAEECADLLASLQEPGPGV